jgi:hypothetical protein
VQRCKSAYGLWKGGKVDDRITDYRVRSTEKLIRGTGWLEYSWLGVVLPLRGVALFEVGIALRAILAASKVGAWLRRALLWWSARRSLAPTREQSSREAARLARSANPTRGRRWRFVRRLANGRDAVAPLPEAEPFPIRQTLTAIRQRRHAVPTLPEAGKGA